MSDNNFKNISDIDSIIDEVLASEQTTSTQTMLDLPDPIAPLKDTAKSTLFETNKESDIEYINSAMTNSNFPAGSKPQQISSPKILTNQEKREEKEFQQFDEEINYRKKLEKIMKRSAPTEPFAMDIVNDEQISSPVGEESILLSENTDADFEYFSHDQMGKFDKISVRVHTEEEKSADYSPYLLANKLLLFTVLMSFAIYAVEVAFFFLFFRNVIEMNYLYYLALIAIAIIPLGIGLCKYFTNPTLKVKRKMNFLNMALNSIIVVVLAIVVILIITLLTSASVLDFSDLLPKIVIPIIMLLNYPLGILIYYLLYKSERFFE